MIKMRCFQTEMIKCRKLMLYIIVTKIAFKYNMLINNKKNNVENFV